MASPDFLRSLVTNVPRMARINSFEMIEVVCVELVPVSKWRRTLRQEVYSRLQKRGQEAGSPRWWEAGEITQHCIIFCYWTSTKVGAMINPLSPDLKMQILLAVLDAFCMEQAMRICLNIKTSQSSVIVFSLFLSLECLNK